jgi:DNA-binding transcriptional MerR regulator
VSNPGQSAPARPRKSAAAFRTIGEVAAELDLPTHVLRFWETKFPQVKPVKRSGNRRYYRPEDIGLLRLIRQWLYQDGYTIRGAQQLLESSPPAAAGEVPGVPRPSAAAMPDAHAPAAIGAATAARSEAEKAGLSQADAARLPLRKPAVLDPRARAELEEIRRELRQARALLGAALPPSKS